jgi:hypothetical protein
MYSIHPSSSIIQRSGQRYATPRVYAVRAVTGSMDPRERVYASAGSVVSRTVPRAHACPIFGSTIVLFALLPLCCGNRRDY